MNNHCGWRFVWMMLACAGLSLTAGGCGAVRLSPTLVGKWNLPRGYRPLRVKNACFVEAVHFYDVYQTQALGGAQGWARVLHWSDRKDDYTIATGHAVTVFTQQGKLWFYDVNFGVLPLAVSVERREDLSEVTPAIFANYPRMHPTLARYEEERPQWPDDAPPIHAHAGIDTGVGASVGSNDNLKQALQVAQILGRTRPVQVVDFVVTSDGGKPRPGAATLFVFGGALCIFSPEQGTRVSPLHHATAADFAFAGRWIAQVIPGATQIHLHGESGSVAPRVR